MNLIVKKFGGTSLSNIEKMNRAISYVKKEIALLNKVIVVVSAMGQETDRLLSIIKPINSKESSDEYSSLLASGEQVSSSIFSMLLQESGIKSKSFLGWQIPIYTFGENANAKIKDIDTYRLKKTLRLNVVPVVAGFQGIDGDQRITTLGRGGSDTTAVALAAKLGAKRCDIYTDVKGVYTADPRIVKKAKKLEKVNFEEMLELASLGAKVLQTRSVQLALKYDIRLQVLSSLTGKKGTILVKDKKQIEDNLIRGIAHSREEARITLIDVDNKPGISSKIFSSLAEKNVNVDMIVQSGSEKELKVSFTFTVPQKDTKKTKETMEKIRKDIGFTDISVNKNICKVSVIGLGMKSHVGVAGTMFTTLAKNNINILAISRN